MHIQSVDQIRPLAHTQEQLRALAAEFEERPAAELAETLNTERAALAETMQLASRNGEDGEIIYDFSGVEGWKDKTESQRREEFAKANDRLNVMGAVLSGKTFYANFANSLSAMPADVSGDTPRYTPDDIEGIVAMNRGRGQLGATVGDLFVAQPEYQAFFAEPDPTQRRGRGFDMRELDGNQFVNAVFQRTGVSDSGWEPQIIRSGRVVYADLRPDQLIDFLPRVQASSGGYSWIQETSLSAESTASREPFEKAEGVAAGELKLELTEKSVKIHKLPVIIPVTEEQLDDEMGARQYLEMRLPQQVRQRLDYQALLGNGTAPNMQGFSTVSGINTFAAGSSSKILDQFLFAAREIWVDTYRMPTLSIVTMADCVKILTSKDDDGQYLYGSPNQSAFMDRNLWGFRLVVNDALPANTAYVLDTSEKLMITGKGIELVYGYVDDDFKKNQVTIRCSMRANFADLRPTSTCKITALNNAS